MTEKELIKKLSALKSINADSAWVKKNRDVLSCQIFNGSESTATNKLNFFIQLSWLSKRILQPAPIAILIVVFFAGTGLVGYHASRNATPGEPLYIAKSISEKAHFAATFDETARVRLSLEFAGQRATEIEKVAANDIDDPRIEELSASFQQEIDSARQRLETIKKTATKQAAADAATAKQKPIAKPTEPQDETDDVFSAEASKDENGIQISTPDTQQALEEVEKLFAEKKYNDAAIKLEEIEQQLEN